MAGEWLKFDCSLPEKPEVLAITVAMGWDDPDLTVGKLMRVFRWFDQHTIGGNAPGVTAALLDRVVGVSGIAEAMANVHWLLLTPEGVSLVNFERHNGATAKSRAQTAKRVASHRSNGSCNDTSVTEALAREEKKEKNTHTQLAPDWILPKPWGEWAIAEYPAWTPETVRSIASQFADHYRAKGDTSADWQASWRKWCHDPLTHKTLKPKAAPRAATGPPVQPITTPGRPGRDPEAERLEREFKESKPAKAEHIEALAEVRQKIQLKGIAA